MPKPDIDLLWHLIKERLCQATGDIEMQSPQEFSQTMEALNSLSEEEYNLMLAKISAHCLQLPLVSEDRIREEIALLISLKSSNPGLERNH
jgi:hypothetical protein